MSTDRVEINPDNTNKTLEQSQEELAKQGVNVNDIYSDIFDRVFTFG